MTPYIRSLLPVAGHTAAIYVFLVVLIRFVGRRALGQLSVIDLVIVIALGSAVETAMVNGNTTLAAGIVSAGTLFLLNRIVTVICLRSKKLRHLVTGGPTLLIHDGHFVEEHLKRAGLTQEDVLEAVREREEPDIANIRFAVLECDGAIHVVPKRATPPKAGKQPIQGAGP